MKAVILTTALLCALPCVATAQSVEQPSSTVRVPAPLSIDLPAKAISPALTNFDNYKGAYDLSDGRVISLTKRGTHIFAEIDGMEKVQLVAADMNSFVATDRTLQLNLGLRSDGEVRGEVLLAARNTIAGLPVKPVLLTFGGN